ncbi:hypothetical protein [Pseudoflavonifractor sp. AF19-9AC]|uniref:hypothetical protein n=1 Tax=Pseudoflavonifractor sp. AF19-9AC TaxID=2292244 RepID=UPI0013146429|nr:hypothetical protein [Pseudoflavonifractor sp. AF19-9AC]
MKRILPLAVLMLSFLSVCGCQSEPSSASLPASSQSSQSSSGDLSLPNPEEEVVWSEKMLETLFSQKQEETWEYLDCALFSDKAFDRVGVVLFQDPDDGTCNTAFFDADGYFALCGIRAQPAEEPDLTYLGNGAVSFRAVYEDGHSYLFTITFSEEEHRVNFVVDSEPCP